MDRVIQPKLFISYAHAEGKSTVDAFWTQLYPFLNKPGRQWRKWDDQELLAGQDWGDRIIQALEHDCNCCILLLSDLFTSSSYIADTEWPRTLARHEREGILFFPIVFGVLHGGLAALPLEMRRFQVYWPTVVQLYVPPPVNVATPDQMRQCYKDVKDRDATRDRFLSGLAAQMNERFDGYLHSQSLKPAPTSIMQPVPIHRQFATHVTDEISFAKVIFGPFSYEKRYRDSSSRGCYFLRSADSTLDECFSHRNWILVVGHPLAGKTRAIFEAIRRMMSKATTVAVWRFTPPDRKSEPLMVPSFPKAEHPIIWLDDIDTHFRDLLMRGYTKTDINDFLKSAAEAGITLAATIRTGPTYYDFRHRFGLDDHLWDKLESIFIPRLDGQEEELFMTWYRGSFSTTLPDKFDHHPGSLFLNLEAMRDRWHNMDGIVRAHGLNLNVEHARDIMRALHVFYVMEAYGPGGTFRIDHLRLYLRRIAERQFAGTSIAQAFLKAVSHLHRVTADEWEELVLFLAQDEFHLGFLRNEGDHLLTETAYLDYIVGPDGQKNIAQTIEEYFSIEERSQLGLAITRYNFLEVFRDNPPVDERGVEKLARKLKPLGLERDPSVWNHLVSLCTNFSMARRALELMLRAGVQPDIVTFNTVIEQAGDYETGRTVLKDMQAAGVHPNAITFSLLMNRVKDYESARVVLKEMRDARVHADVVIFNGLMHKANDFESARTVFREMETAGIRPNRITFSTLISKAANYESASAVLKDMESAGFQPEVIVFSALISKANDYESARIVLNHMQAVGIQPDVVTFNALLAKTSDYNNATTVLKELEAAGIRPNVITFSTLIDKAEDYECARSVLKQMEGAGIQPNDVTFNGGAGGGLFRLEIAIQ
jgi:hypothetical protein